MAGGRFKLLPTAGMHKEDGVKYYKGGPDGDVVTSDRDLDKLFANKFERLDGKTKRPRDKDDSLDNSGKVMDDPLHRRLKTGAVKAEEESNRLPRGAAAKSNDGARVRGDSDEDEDDVPKKAKGPKDKRVDEEDEADEAPRKKKHKKVHGSGTKKKKKKKKVLPAEEETGPAEDKTDDTE